MNHDSHHEPLKTICMFTPAAEGGHARYTAEMLSALSQPAGTGCRVELVTAENVEAQFRSTEYPVHAVLPPIRDRYAFKSPLHWAASRIVYYPRREWAFLKWLKSRPDIAGVHLQEWKPWLAAPMIRAIQKMGKKVFYTAHNILPHRYPKWIPKWLMHAWIRRACRACDGLFVLSDQLAEKLAGFLGNPHPPIHVTPHGVWTVRDSIQGPSMQDRLAWKRLLFFGAIRQNKGLDLLLRAAENLPGFGITIAGSPDEPEYFQSEILPRVKQLRDAGRQVELLDRFVADDELGKLFATHSAIVLPYTKGFVAQSGVAFMALAYGLPMVASDAGGLGDLMREFKVGVTFHEATPEHLTAAVNELYADGNHADLAAQILAAKLRYSWDVAARETIAGYSAAFQARRETADAHAVPTHPAH